MVPPDLMGVNNGIPLGDNHTLLINNQPLFMICVTK